PQAEARHLAPAHAPAARARHVRLTHAVDDFRREAGSIVVDLDHDLIIGPGRGHLDTLAGEVDRVLQNVSEPVQNRRIARPDRLTRIVLGNLALDGHARPAVRRYHFLDQG